MSSGVKTEIAYCRRCGSSVTAHDSHFVCTNGHTIYVNAAPAVGILIFNNTGKLLIGERVLDPHKGLLDFPGGFCEQTETLESAVAREVQEETGLRPNQYSTPVFILSGVDDYDYAGETIHVVAAVFRAILLDDNTPVQSNDDITQLRFMDMQDVVAADIAFPSLRSAFLRVKGGS